jgi:cytoskeletal protein RodZ
MASVAEQLRLAREAQGMSINAAAEVTKIRGDHLRALEEGNYDAFVAPVYIRGFVRSYARLLHLDEPTVLAALDSELSLTEKFKEPPPLSNEPRGLLDILMLQMSRVNWSIVLPVLLAGIILLAGAWAYQAWRRHKTNDPLANLRPALYHPKADLKDLYLPVPTNPPPPARPSN